MIPKCQFDVNSLSVSWPCEPFVLDCAQVESCVPACIQAMVCERGYCLLIEIIEPMITYYLEVFCVCFHVASQSLGLELVQECNELP